jgi:hypothetical protein
MRKRRICYVGALGLALAVAIPGSAMGQDVQNLEAGFQPQKNANVVFGQPASLSSKFSKKGTLRVNTFLSGTGPPPALEVFDLHLPEELKLNGKGLKPCNPTQITGQPAATAQDVCKKSLVGTGLATLINIPAQGTALLFYGTNNTILVHITVGAAPPITLIGDILSSPLGSPYKQLIHIPVSETAGGPVPSGINVERTELTKISKTFKDKKILKKAKKAKKQGNTEKYRRLKKKAKKNFVSAKCTDGTLSYQADYQHAPPDPDQVVPYEQPCTK